QSERFEQQMQGQDFSHDERFLSQAA
nr:RecName: Full=Antifungal protein 1; AltName: Full=Pf-AFP1 [Passiflora edulis]